jgi:hypothetical protein
MKTTSNKRKVIIRLILVLSVATFLAFSFLIWQYKRYEKAYETVVPNAPKLAVLEQFGKPAKILPCRPNGSWDGELSKESESCVEEFWYFSHLSPEQWTIGFDKDGRAISKYHFVSP